MALAFNVARADGLHALESSVTDFVNVLHAGLLSQIKYPPKREGRINLYESAPLAHSVPVARATNRDGDQSQYVSVSV